jgi:anti-anti-sigma regulatory factor
MLRITVTEPTSSSKDLKLEGRITDASVAELRRLCEELLARNHTRLTLDLADVSFIDDAGIDLFRSLARRDVEVTGCSPFLAELLKEVLPCS